MKNSCSIYCRLFGAIDNVFQIVIKNYFNHKYLMSEFINESRTVQQELAQLGNGQAVIMGIADDVMDTKKKIEYGRYNIISELEDFVIKQNRVINNAIEDHVQSIMTSLSQSQDRILSNVTSTVEQELSQIWRQINFLNQQIKSYANISNLINGESHFFFNATIVTMDNVQFTISIITKKTIDIEKNLNYLLGRLSILTQEFKQLKNGLGTSLGDMNQFISTIIKSNKDSSTSRQGKMT
ncbi:uncharacterized protein LOC141533489 isoform X2 [Cotesia typhae]|uniref:uncharacterized protein LOC141533489 isoform X2 n=1 Tax=Cotesia typhae TaxID=2053667 RepID=UPI003D69DAD8